MAINLLTDNLDQIGQTESPWLKISVLVVSQFLVKGLQLATTTMELVAQSPLE